MNQISNLPNYSKNELVSLIVTEIYKKIDLNNSNSYLANNTKIPLGISNRHIHMTN